MRTQYSGDSCGYEIALLSGHCLCQMDYGFARRATAPLILATRQALLIRAGRANARSCSPGGRWSTPGYRRAEAKHVRLIYSDFVTIDIAATT
jgi:hypothetical protein